jgi:hypothetical protein
MEGNADEAGGDRSDRLGRPPNGYILYCIEKRPELRLTHPNVPNSEISRLLGANWKSLPEQYRRPYKDRARVLQTEFKRSYPGYKYEKARNRRQQHELQVQESLRTLDIAQLAKVDPVVMDQLMKVLGAQQSPPPPPGPEPAPQWNMPGQTSFGQFEDFLDRA